MGLTKLDRDIFEAVKSGNIGLSMDLLSSTENAKFALAKFNETKQSLLSISIQKGFYELAPLLLNHPSGMCAFVLEPADGYDKPLLMVETRCTRGAPLGDLLSQISHIIGLPKDLSEYLSYKAAEEAKIQPPLSYWQEPVNNDDPCFSYKPDVAVSSSAFGHRAARVFAAPPPLPAYGFGGGGAGYGHSLREAETTRLVAWLSEGNEGTPPAGWAPSHVASDAAVTVSANGGMSYVSGFGGRRGLDAASARLVRELEDERIAEELQREVAATDAARLAERDDEVAANLNAWLTAGNDGPMPAGWSPAAGGPAFAATAPLPLAAGAPIAPGVAGGAVAGPMVLSPAQQAKIHTIKNMRETELVIQLGEAAVQLYRDTGARPTYDYALQAFCDGAPIDAIKSDLDLLGKFDAAWHGMDLGLE